MFEHTPDILTFKECQTILKIGKNTLLNLIHEGEIEAFRIGNLWKIPKVSIIEFVQNRF